MPAVIFTTFFSKRSRSVHNVALSLIFLPFTLLCYRLLARAKAGRAERIQAERALEKNYVTKNDLKSDADAVKVQTAIFKLSNVGGLIESGYLALAAETLQSGSWERDLPVTGSNVSDSKSFIEDLALLKRACLANDIDQAKLAYVTTARSLKIYAKSSSRDENFKLL